MAQAQEDTNHFGDNLEAHQGPLKTERLEKFPSFVPTRGLFPNTKAKSLTEADINKNDIGEESLAAAILRLKNEKPPESLTEARDRRASAKKTRRDTINLIRSRTALRLLNKGRPSVEVPEKVDLAR